MSKSGCSLIMQQRSVTKRRIRKVGDSLVAGSLSEVERREALELVGYWRAAHIEPLQRTLLEIEKLCGKGSSTILVSRLKRIDTIVNKLGRENSSANYNLTTLRDVAGCRLIVDNLDQVLLYADLISQTDMFHKSIDHMKKPKGSGYRGFHIICRHDAAPQYGFKNMNVEVQIRSRLQHYWATAVETYDQIEETRLKFDQGSDLEKRYFCLASEVMNNDVSNDSEEIKELRYLDSRLHVLERLAAAVNSMYVICKREIDRSSTCLLKVDLSMQQIVIDVYPSGEEVIAAEKYTELETGKEELDIIYLLARADSLSDLSFAYSNYSSHISKFVKWLGKKINA